MRALALLFVLGILEGALAQRCPGSWYLEPDDCICMRSTDGALLKTQTKGCCSSMGYKTYDDVGTTLQEMADGLVKTVTADLSHRRSAQSTETTARSLRTAARG